MDRINLDTSNVTLKGALEMTSKFEHLPAKDLTPDQLALLHLRQIVANKPAKVGVGAKECFICGTAA